MAEIQITDGALVVTIYEVPEERPSLPRPLETLPDTTGALVIYERIGSLLEVPVSGRLLSAADVTCIETWASAGALLSLIARDASETSGWRIKTGPPPRIRRKDGDSADWLVDLRLWRIP